MHNPDLDKQAEELAELLDSLMAGGTQHVNLTAGEQMRVQTVSSTECSKPGACAIPTLGSDDDMEGE